MAGSAMKVVVLTGPESAGKSTLCAALAERFAAPVVPEYVREYMDGLGRDTCLADITPIAQRQWQHEQAARAPRPPLLLLDTHLLSNHQWSMALFGQSPAWITGRLARQRYDAVFLLDPEGLPWQADGLRCQPDVAQRRAFHAALAQWLTTHRQPLVHVAGDWQQRYRQIEAALIQLLAAPGRPAPSTR
ncbi:MAG: AAA family ATPase [Comamonas sp.]|nr:AAA family ATPase [Comamonas sp.]